MNIKKSNFIEFGSDISSVRSDLIENFIATRHRNIDYEQLGDFRIHYHNIVKKLDMIPVPTDNSRHGSLYSLGNINPSRVDTKFIEKYYEVEIAGVINTIDEAGITNYSILTSNVPLIRMNLYLENSLKYEHNINVSRVRSKPGYSFDTKY